MRGALADVLLPLVDGRAVSVASPCRMREAPQSARARMGVGGGRGGG